MEVEQIIAAKEPKMAKFYKAVLIIACLLAITTIPQTMAYGLILAAVLIAFTVLVFRHYRVEYEYSLVADELTVDKIMSKNLRRRCGVYNIGKAELIAEPTSQAAMRMAGKDLRTYDYSDNVTTEHAFVIYTYNSENEMVRIHIQPNERMAEAIASVAKRGVFQVEDTFEPYAAYDYDSQEADF